LMLGLDEAPAGLVAAPVEPVPAELAPSEIGRVTALPLRADGTCATLETFRRSGDFHRLIPLVDTRVRVFARTEVFRRIGMATDGFGTPFLVGGSR
ncbi:MAG: hypothetical protein ACOC8K_08285, partial [Gemmatimonadota bacterium]